MRREASLVKWRRRPAVQRPLRYVRRLFAMSPEEIGARLEPGFAFASGRGGGMPALDRSALCDSLEKRFLFGPAQARAILAAWSGARPAEAASLVETARRLLHEVEIFGVVVSLEPGAIDWQAALPDLRGTWELNRHAHLFTLARAFVLTGESVFAQRVTGLLGNWLDANPPRRGVNWSSSLEVAMRAISWLWTLPLVADWPGITPAFLRRWLGSFHDHYDYIGTHLSVYTDPTNHLIGETTALFLLSNAVPDLPEASQTGERALALLSSQVERQIAPDGVGREHSTGYLRFVLDLCLQTIAVANRSGRPAPAAFLERTRSMLDFLGALAGTDGAVPHIGDSDDARGAPLPELAGWDFRDALSAGAALLGAPELSAGVSEFAMWLAGADAIRAVPAGAAHARSRIFAQGGYCLWTAECSGRRMALLFDTGPLGLWPNASHGHADALSIQLKLGDRWILGDPGTGGYAAAERVRDTLRGTAAHNTVTVDSLDQASRLDVFKWLASFNVRLLDSFSDKHFDYALAMHDGYERLRRPVTHYRAVLFVRPPAPDAGWIVADRLEGKGRHCCAVRFHCPPGTAVRQEGRRGVMAGDLRMSFSEDCCIETGLWSRWFGQWEEAPAAVVEREVDLPFACFTFLAVGHAGAALAVEAERSGTQFAARCGRQTMVWARDSGRDRISYQDAERRFER